MTRQENILTLNEHLEHWKRLLSEKICDQSEGEKTIDALQNAIKALEQQPCEDCISRKQAIELFVGWWSDLLEYHKEDECFDALLKALPPVTPQQKTGYISIDDAMSAFDDFMCNDIEPEGQEVFLELLKDRAERSGG